LDALRESRRFESENDRIERLNIETIETIETSQQLERKTEIIVI
jgi:hypothetical protein